METLKGESSSIALGDKELKILLGEILRMAVRDFYNKRFRADVQEFLKSGFFEDITDQLRFQPEEFQRRLLEGTKMMQKIHTPYR